MSAKDTVTTRTISFRVPEDMAKKMDDLKKRGKAVRKTIEFADAVVLALKRDIEATERIVKEAEARMKGGDLPFPHGDA